ncbi:MAG TPA: RNA polymerase sigma factor [Urbifossiella sp.]|nr:RNA polymerase sigma factor [Urbifossiella sp.]
MGVTSRGLFGVLARLSPPPPADSDADLLDRFVRAADQAAFAGLVRRHGPMVLAVCRRRLGREADAEDAFQAVFLALATSAAAVRRREALAGWLYRAAYLVALKAAGRRARRPADPLPDEVPMPAPPPPAWEAAEVRAAVDAEVAGLPDKLRAVVVLCLIEGRTNAEAAAALGTPVGTVDSRLHAARKTLQARLTRRGVAVGLGITLEHLVGGPVGATGPHLLGLISDTIPAVLAEAARPGAGAVPAGTADLARGVTVMTTTKVRALAALGAVVGLLGTAGAGAYLAAAPDPAAATTAAQKADPLPAAPAKAEAAPAVVEQTAPAPVGGKGTAGALERRFGQKLPPNGVPLRELLDSIEDETELVIRVDVAAFRRLGDSGGEGGFSTEQLLQGLYQTQVILPRRADQLPTRDVLADALAQAHLPVPCTYQVRGSQLVILPAYRPPTRPGSNPLAPSADDDDAPALSAIVMHEQIYGGVVTVSADRKPLTDILTDLRKQTGANIVLDPRCSAQAGKATLTVSLSDVRLYDAVRVIADMAELKMVYAGNIYYVTTEANARTFQPATPRTLYSAPAPVPAPAPSAAPTQPKQQ